MNHDQLAEVLIEKVESATRKRRRCFGAQTLRWLERHILLDIVDAQWKDHLLTLDHLKEGIGLRGYGQKDPLVEFKREAFMLFEDMMDRIDTESVRFLFLVRPAEGNSDGCCSCASDLVRHRSRRGAAETPQAMQRLLHRLRGRSNSGRSASSRICSSRLAQRSRGA